MIKRFLTVFACIAIAAATRGQAEKFIHVTHNILADSANNKLTLNGVNLGGWLLWEGWIFGGGFVKETNIKQRLTDLTGKAKSDDFIKRIYQYYITEADIKAIAANGFNCVRLPFNYRIFDTTSNGAAPGFAFIDSVVAWCNRYGVYVVLDMHAAPGGQNNAFISDKEKTRLWENEENKQAAVKLWSLIAKRYANEATIAGYDLLNEPVFPNTNDLLDLYRQLVQAIRITDKHHLLIIEGNVYAHNFKNFTLPPDTNTIASFHFYTWFAENNKAKSLAKTIEGIPAETPAWCGEWGEDKLDNLEEIKDLLNKLPNNCGSAFWTWKRVYTGNGKHPLCQVQQTPEWKKIMTWITWKLGKPTPAEAEKGMNDFLEAIQYANCQLNEDVIKVVVK